MRCTATVPARWHTPAHQCQFEAVIDGVCAKHMTRPDQLRVAIAKLENEEKELVAMLKRAINGVRQDIRKRKSELKTICHTTPKNPAS